MDSIEDYSEIDTSKNVYVVIDRLVVNLDKDNLNRLADSIQIAFFEGNGECAIEVIGKKIKAFSNRFELDGISFESPSEHLFSFNPYGACKMCEGFGSVLGIDEDKVILTINSIYDGAINCWKVKNLAAGKRFILNAAKAFIALMANSKMMKKRLSGMVLKDLKVSVNSFNC